MTLYHGTSRNTDGLVLHEGICLASDADTSTMYAGPSGEVYEACVDMDSLRIVVCDSYRYEDDVTPADDPEYREEYRRRGVDVLAYQDVDPCGRIHDCFRLISDRALAAVVVVVS